MRLSEGTLLALRGSAEHECLVNVAKPVNLGFGRLESQLELLLDGLEITDVASSALEQRNLARLLVRGRESVLETGIPVTELVAPPLLRLDALLADGLSAGVVATTSDSGRLELLVLILALVVAPAGPALVPEDRPGGSGSGDGVESLGAGNGRLVGNGGIRRGVSATASARTASGGVVRRHLSCAQAVGERMGGDAGTFGGVGATRRGSCHRRVGVVADVAREVERVEGHRGGCLRETETGESWGRGGVLEIVVEATIHVGELDRVHVGGGLGAVEVHGEHLRLGRHVWIVNGKRGYKEQTTCTTSGQVKIRE